MRKPDFLCIGSQKAGTTWINQHLSSRPDIWTPPIKEIHFFDFLYGMDSADWARGHIRGAVREAIRNHALNAPNIALDYMEYLTSLVRDDMFTKRWYARVWSRAPEGKKTLDVTPEYCGISEDGIAYFKKLLPDAKLIYILRDPVKRALSQIRMNVRRRKLQPKTLAEWVEQSDLPEVNHRGDYRAYVPRWQAAFGPEQLLILPFGEIATNPMGFMQQVERFLDVPPRPYLDLESKVFEGSGLTVPSEIGDILRKRYDDQYRFLHDTFPAEFVAKL